jgi:hypothetical protein
MALSLNLKKDFGREGQLVYGQKRSLLPGLNLTGSLENLKLGQPRVLTDRFQVDAFLEGKAQVEVAALPTQAP